MKTLFLTFLMTLQANACLWVDGTTIDGEHRRVEGHFPAKLLTQSLAKSAEEEALKSLLARQSARQDDFPQKEFEGVQEVLKGNYDRAIGIFEQAESDYPGRYSTAVNLGTAYELKGELEIALKWIREGIRRNPKSHLGTEWLHVEILKTRIKLKEHPGYLSQNHVIQLPDSYSKTTVIEIEDGKFTIDQIADSILYQLQERMIFVKPPDPVVADLLFTLGEIEGRTNVVESGIQLFEMAKNYGFSNSNLIAGELKRYEEAALQGTIRRTARVGLLVLALILFLILAWRKRWFFMSRKAYLEHRADRLKQSEI